MFCTKNREHLSSSIIEDGHLCLTQAQSQHEHFRILSSVAPK